MRSVPFASILIRVVAAFWTLLVLGSAAIVGMSASATAIGPLTDQGRSLLVVQIAVYLVQAMFCVTIHEFGHMATAKMVGWRVRSVTVGLLSYQFASRQFSFAKKDADLFSGFVKVAPPPTVGARTYFWSAMLVVSGGCIANFLLAAMTFPFLGALKNVWLVSDIWKALLGSTCIISLTLGTANIIPFSAYKGERSDGLRLLYLLIWRIKQGTTASQLHRG